MEVILLAAGGTWLFYLLYLVYAGYHGAQLRAKAGGPPIKWLAKILVYPVVIVGLVLDVAWNCTIGTVLYLELPWKVENNNWTFTYRVKAHKGHATWRGKQSSWWAGFLDPFDPGHTG